MECLSYVRDLSPGRTLIKTMVENVIKSFASFQAVRHAHNFLFSSVESLDNLFATTIKRRVRCSQLKHAVFAFAHANSECIIGKCFLENAVSTWESSKTTTT